MRPHVMIIDDTPDQLQLMRSVFKMVDPTVQTVTARSGDEALNILRADLQNLPRVILLDLKMPRKSGQEVLFELKTDPTLKSIPVCIFSNGDIHSDICECYQRGASFYFRKPSGLDLLKEFIETFNKVWFKIACHC